MSLLRRDERIAAAYTRWLQAGHIGTTEDLEDAFIAGWLEGGRQTLRDSAELAGLVPALRELISYFEVES
jgi:hypothetical protein